MIEEAIEPPEHYEFLLRMLKNTILGNGRQSGVPSKNMLNWIMSNDNDRRTCILQEILRRWEIMNLIGVALQLALFRTSTIFTWSSHTLVNLVMRMNRKHTSCVVGTVDRRGYGGQQKGTICDARGPYPSIWRTLKPVFRQIRLICWAYESLRYPHLEICRFLCSQQQRHNWLLYPLAHARGVTIYY